MAELVRTLTADRGDSGRRLDLMLRRHLADLGAATRTRLQGWIAGGLVTVNGAPVTRVSTRTLFGDVVQVHVPAAHTPQPMEAESAAIQVVYEDDDLLALDKPAGMVVHPTYRNTRGTVMNALLWHARAWPHGRRPSLVGRLDKDTSGLLLVAKTPAMHRALQQAGDAGAIDKDYLAIVHGRVPASVSIDLPLGRDPDDRRRIVVTTAGARSLTRVEPLGTRVVDGIAVSLLRCRLVTGRTHQIRVHLAARGWPIVGDSTYGSMAAVAPCAPFAAAVRAFPRQALHAWRVALTQPVTRHSLWLESCVPGDMQHLCDLAGLAPSTPAIAGIP